MAEKRNKITYSFVPVPHELFDVDLANGLITPAEFVVLCAIFRKTYGWQRERDWIRNKDLAMLCNMHSDTVRKIASSLNTKDYIDIIYICSDCKSVVEYDPKEYQCPNCKSKSTPHKCYEQKLITDSIIPDTTPAGNPPPPYVDNPPPCGPITDPLRSYHRPPSPKPIHSNNPQAPIETLLKERRRVSLSGTLTKEDLGADWENFDILEERENFEKKEPEEEKREERDFRLIKEPEPNQTENEGMVKFTAGLLAGIGNPSAFAEEKPREREEKTTEKEVKDLLNSHMANNWRTQISESDNEHIKEIMKYDYKHIEASCEDRLTKNRPAIPKLFPKWVLDGLRSGIKAKKLTQLEKEAFLENELEKSYDNGNGDKILCRDVIKKLYSVIQIVGIMNYRYRAEMDWCEMPWQCLED